MTFIPASVLDKWRTTSRKTALVKLANLLEFRDILTENKTRNGDRVPLMELYREAAEAMLISDETLRHDMAAIREYPDVDLLRWIDNGVSFDHFRKANDLAEIAKKTPAQLLNECIDPGNATGQTMTVNELCAHALGEKQMPPAHVQGIGLLSKLANFPARFKWDESKTRAFLDDLTAFRKRWFE